MQAFKAIHLRKRGGISALQAQLSNREEVKKRKRLKNKRFGGLQILCRNYWTNISLNDLRPRRRSTRSGVCGCIACIYPARSFCCSCDKDVTVHFTQTPTADVWYSVICKRQVRRWTTSNRQRQNVDRRSHCKRKGALRTKYFINNDLFWFLITQVNTISCELCSVQLVLILVDHLKYSHVSCSIIQCLLNLISCCGIWTERHF